MLCTESESITWGLESPWKHILGQRLSMTASMLGFAFIFHMMSMNLFAVFSALAVAYIIELLMIIYFLESNWIIGRHHFIFFLVCINSSRRGKLLGCWRGIYHNEPAVTSTCPLANLSTLDLDFVFHHWNNSFYFLVTWRSFWLVLSVLCGFWSHQQILDDCFWLISIEFNSFSWNRSPNFIKHNRCVAAVRRLGRRPSMIKTPIREKMNYLYERRKIIRRQRAAVLLSRLPTQPSSSFHSFSDIKKEG